jgi:purine-binding chemotaxis protein CheW
MSQPSQAGVGGRRWDLLARAAARRAEGGADAGDTRQLLTFLLDGAAYALPVERVREIVRLRSTTPMPRVPDPVRGVISLRGEIVQVVDLRRCLGLPETQPTRRSRIIIVRGGNERLAGLLVDAVTEVMAASADSLRPTSGEMDAVESLCMRGDRFVSLVDLERVLAIDAGK